MRKKNLIPESAQLQPFQFLLVKFGKFSALLAKRERTQTLELTHKLDITVDFKNLFVAVFFPLETVWLSGYFKNILLISQFITEFLNIKK